MMKNSEEVSRRSFLKKSAIATAAAAGGNMLVSCNKPEKFTHRKSLPACYGKSFHPDDGVVGLLFSQVGYEKEHPVKIILRSPRKDMFPDGCKCLLLPAGPGEKYASPCVYWGEIWKSHWWIAEFTEIDEEGEWDIEIVSDGKCLFEDSGVQIKENILWDSTIEWSSVDMLERRTHFTKVGAGWQDAGTLWVESPAQSAMVIALAELIEHAADRFDKTFLSRIYKQIIVGCDYLVMSQEKARELGFPMGALSHDLLGHEKDVLPNDAMKAVVALEKAIRLLPVDFQEKKEEYKVASRKTFNWLTTAAKPMGDYGLSRFLRGLTNNDKVPENEWQTRDLVILCWASIEQWKNTNHNAKEIAVRLAEEIIARQIPEEQDENGYYGHFKEFQSTSYSEKSFTQGIVNNEFGADIGGFYPNYLMPLIEMIRLWPDHKDVARWKNCLQQFAYGYLIPACYKNPFLLVPQGIFGEEGAVWFCGTFHGTNAIYGYTAALALELAQLFNEPRLKDIAYGNLQWLAGLNGGITQENLAEGCVVFSMDIQKGLALPASMICGIGKRWAGTWFQTRGIICNGFSTGKQFIYDTEPRKANDGPFSLTDEDWIPHSAGWLTGLMRLKV